MESISVNIEIREKPITTNLSHIEINRGRRRMRVPTYQYTKFKLSLAQYFSDRKFDSFKEIMREPDIAVHANICFYLPPNKFWKRVKKSDKTQIAKRCLDTDNAVKPTLDAISQAIGFDDSCITKIISEKRPSNDLMPEYLIDVTLTAYRLGFSQVLP